MNIKRVSAFLTAFALSASFTSCGDKDDKSSSKNNVVEAQTGEVSTVEASEIAEPTSDVDWQQLKDNYQDEILNKNNREHDGYYLIDYVDVEFKGYEHDSEVEVTVDWDKLAADLGNGITPEILEHVYGVSVHNTKENSLDRTELNDLVNGEEVNVHLSEHTLQSAFKQKYTEEIKYLDDNVWGDLDNPLAVSGLKTKVYLENVSDVDTAQLEQPFETAMEQLMEESKEYVDSLKNDYGPISINFVLNVHMNGWIDEANCKVNSYTLENTYLATRTANSYIDNAYATIPDNMAFNIYKLDVERKGSGEQFIMYYRTDVRNLLLEDGKMLIGDDQVKVTFAGTADELMPDEKDYDTKIVK